MKAEEFKKKWKLTQDQMAALLGVTRSTVSHWTMTNGDEEPDTIKRQILLIDLAFTLLEKIGDGYPVLIETFEASRAKRDRF